MVAGKRQLVEAVDRWPSMDKKNHSLLIKHETEHTELNKKVEALRSRRVEVSVR